MQTYRIIIAYLFTKGKITLHLAAAAVLPAGLQESIIMPTLKYGTMRIVHQCLLLDRGEEL